ncbi:hypothetical protein EG328_001764 [Venturia inaequalis]|uniref:Uncharacterized protein n=1 Tax=Venturia inaequalis TaxID=5025 RepID=A0A8H3UWP9_VENIN|nr:hypothetical protein EG327_010485 [Venturia inaequalis]KAE9977971.1 hypothetical protein EG328_001764 [Venturia inaequalis]RDI83516.1 hypothetical protein Vi05172_g6708 [Venturia inaequalis]
MSYAPRKTTEPAPNPIEEPTGEIINDSLAADSLRSGGQFADGHASISGQKAVGSTAANTDTSGATTLGPAPDAEARLATEEWGESASLNASKSLNETKGEYKTVGGTGSAHTVGTAPSAQGRDGSKGELPKGKDLTEGGFDAGASNASYADVESGRNPSRLAEAEFERRNAGGLVSEGSTGPRVGGVTDKGQYGDLGRDESA